MKKITLLSIAICASSVYAACPDLTGIFIAEQQKKAIEIKQTKCEEFSSQNWDVKADGSLSEKPSSPLITLKADGKFRPVVQGSELKVKAEFTAKELNIVPQDRIAISQKCGIVGWIYSLNAKKDLNIDVRVKCDGEAKERKGSVILKRK